MGGTEAGLTDDEMEAVTAAPSLEGATWRDMRVGQESARDIFERARHGWPAMPAFSFGGILGGEAVISDTINKASAGGGGGGGGGGGRAGGDGADGADDAAGPWWRSITGNPGGGGGSVRRLWLVAGGVLLAVVAAVSLSGGGDVDLEGDKSPLSAGTPRHEAAADGAAAASERGAFSTPSPLRKRLQQVADTALAAGITMPMHTTFEVVRGEGEGKGGMDFVVSVISSEALEAKAAIATPPASAASSDPFDPRVLDPRMTVEELSPSHSLVLNKFNTMRNHALVITKVFQPQEEALTDLDFAAWYRVVSELPGVGFYNSAAEAGASQRHKHMQVIPDDALWDYRPDAAEAIPVDEPISRLVGPSRDLRRVWRLPEFRFQHAFTLLPTAEELASGGGGRGGDPAEGMAAHLRERYVQLLREVGFDTSSVLTQDDNTAVPVSSLPPYNAVLTTRWLMLVPRSRREWGGIDVNGMGFLGALLVRARRGTGAGSGSEGGEEGAKGIAAVRDPGPLTVLEGVTFRSAATRRR